MRYSKNAIFLFTLFQILLLSCTGKTDSANSRSLSQAFKDYWYQGKSEISIYDLKQYRYGEIHEGEATLIFVTEDFSKSKQVKLDNPTKSSDKVSVMKMNFVKKFNTGIYPYSIMTSVFSPVNYKDVIKISMSAQEWCGHVFTQINKLSHENYQVTKHSYFEDEGEVRKQIECEYWEDEIWNLIRIDYKRLPYGTLRVVPSLFRNQNIVPTVATGEITEDFAGSIHTYQLTYPELGRYLQIRFSAIYPHRIVSWEEGLVSETNDTIKTTARYKSDIFIDYWNRNKNADSYLRDSLELHY